jgi:hypothetical protein
MRRLFAGVVAACVLLQPVLAAAQARPPLLPLVPDRTSIETVADGPLMAAIRRQGVFAAARPEERSAPRQDIAGARQGRGWIGRHPALFGALVGAAAGTVAAASMDNELFCGTGSDEDCLFYTNSRFAVGAGIGAGIGALAGWIVSLGRR